jgi:serine/threonine-protein phosphatase 2A regulatory subunit B''
VAFESRDPFAVKNENQDFPDYSEWDKFARAEYIRLAVEDENTDNNVRFINNNCLECQ